jgi:predicted ATPase/class 3 adenylate cyclase/tRNA A-37 threonylcarbamoyl transferase component Bud32
MQTIPGYQLADQIYESENSLVYRGYRVSDNQPVILKILKDTYPSPDLIAWFRREYEITRNLNLPGVSTPYSLETDQNQWVIVLEDFGGESLRRLNLIGTIGIEDFLNLALQIATLLGQIHQQNVIHKDINPANIVYNPTTKEVRLIDFGIATILSRENPTFRNPDVLEGTLAYMSPEQTGRMNRAMDYRTDFYSLGATFYQLLAGRLPFETDDVLEMVHCHIALQPVPPHHLRADIPEVVSAIILKLMAKNAEDRYQSAYGLCTDLEACLVQLHSIKRIDPFPPGQYDLSDRFLIPQKLYGREREIETLLAAFERVSQGASEFLLVTGTAGIGKSALVQEIYKPITQRHGYVVSGKFDQFQRDIPYSALIQAFRELAGQLLTETEERIRIWRKKLLAALGSNGAIIIEVIPEVEVIIGKQPDAVELGPTEAQNRFNLVFQNFITVFAQPEHPLALFLDDLQWADGASLKLMDVLLTAPDSHHLLLIGAYRDNEVDSGHPLRITLASMAQARAVMHEVVLTALNVNAVRRIIADTLHTDQGAARPLAELVIEKTGGNPFFLNEFLKSLYLEELIVFDYTAGRWRWDIERIRARQMTDNVIELMANRVQQLGEEAREMLKMAACIGNQFDLVTLALVAQTTPSRTVQQLSEALNEGFIVPIGDAYKVMSFDISGLERELNAEYKFAHDRIQQAVYSLIPEEESQEIHWHIGQLLLANTSAEEQDEQLFDIVNQLNQGLAFLYRDDAAHCLFETWDTLAELNLKAGEKARASAAYEAAYNYFQVGLGLLGADAWEWQYPLALSLSVDAAEAAYLSGNFDEMETLAEDVLRRARTVLDKVRIYEIKIRAYTAQNQQLKAVQTALYVLKLLDVHFPEKPDHTHIAQALEETHELLSQKPIGDLINRPEMTDPYKLAAMRILTSTLNSAYVAAPELMTLVTCQMIALSVSYGYTAQSSHAYASYGLILCGELGEIERGYRFGQLALFLLDRFEAREYKPRTLMVINNFIRHWREHARETLHPLFEAYQVGMEVGDFEFAAIAIYVYSSLSFFTGKPLDQLEQEMVSYNDVLARVKQRRALYMNGLFRQVVLNLLEQNERPCTLSGISYDETTMLPMHLEANDRTAIYYLYFNKLILCYLFHHYREAVTFADQAGHYLRSAVGSFSSALFHFYDSLARISLLCAAEAGAGQEGAGQKTGQSDGVVVSEKEREAMLQNIADNQEKIERWARQAPMNHQHKFLLVEAERARLSKRDGEAREYYDQAIALAQEHKYLNEEALACELAGRFYMAKGLPRVARTYLRDAHYGYIQWNAWAKVHDLEKTYPQFIGPYEPAHAEHSPHSTRTTTTARSTTTASGQHISSMLDLPSVLKASQAISGEIVLDSLLSRLMRIVIENAGAERGVLILDNEGQWVIEAEGTIEREEVAVSMTLPVGDQEIVPVPISIINYVARTRQVVVLNEASEEGQFIQDTYITLYSPRSILGMPLLNQGKLIGVIYLENRLTAGAFTEDRLEVLKLLSSQVAISIENARLYANLQDALKQQVSLTNAYSRFVPREILQLLGKASITDVQLGDQIQQVMTVLFSDIRDFTGLSEQMSPQENFNFINAYLSRVSPIIRAHRGYIDKYIGDAIMALFPIQPDDAIQTAIEMQQEVTRYNRHRSQDGYQPIHIGAGLHTGNVMLGTVGEAQRMEGTVISDTVNLASRLEGLTKLYGAAIIVSEKMLFSLNRPDRYTFYFLDKVKVKGKKDPVSVFEILDGLPDDILHWKLEAQPDFERGQFHYHNAEFHEAIGYFEKALHRYPEHRASQLYLKRARQFLEYGVPVGWEGIEALSEK